MNPLPILIPLRLVFILCSFIRCYIWSPFFYSNPFNLFFSPISSFYYVFRVIKVTPVFETIKIISLSSFIEAIPPRRTIKATPVKKSARKRKGGIRRQITRVTKKEKRTLFEICIHNQHLYTLNNKIINFWTTVKT